MKINSIYYIILLCIVQSTIAQTKPADIKTEEVNVVKPFTPTISDAVKIKENTPQDDVVLKRSEVLKYTIFSVPVASTFTPNKGVAAKVEPTVVEKLFDNYASLAAGNYGIVDALLNVTNNYKNNTYFNANFKHLSSQGGIKNVNIDNSFFDTSADVTFGRKTESLSWKLNAGIRNQTYNWYGIDPTIAAQLVTDQINPKNTYNSIKFGSQIQLSESILNEASLSFLRFTDNYKSAENRLVVQPKMALKVLDQEIAVNFGLDYLQGSFLNENLGLNTIKYGFTNLAFQPSFNIKKDDFTANIGLSMVYSVATEADKNKFYFYPNATASYKIVGDLMIGFAGFEGGLIQNSYHDFMQINNFVAPNLLIVPTDKKFNIYAGLRGKLSTAIAYDAQVSIINEDYKPLFKNSTYNYNSISNVGFAFGNSFEIIYDTVKTVAVSGEITANFSENVAFTVHGIFSKYVLSNQDEPWNLPNLEISSNLDFKIIKKWNAGFKIFYVGERKDQFTQVSNTAFYLPITKTLQGYFDLNAYVNFNLNSKLGFFVKGNNLANQNYQRWINYPVQGIQLLLGAHYKFDF